MSLDSLLRRLETLLAREERLAKARVLPGGLVGPGLLLEVCGLLVPCRLPVKSPAI